jgi:hypothetical protein
VEKKQIWFVNALGETLFFIEDGGEIEIDLDDGKTLRCACRYIDEYHAWIGDHVYHIREFAGMMEQNVRAYRPAKKKKNDTICRRGCGISEEN